MAKGQYRVEYIAPGIWDVTNLKNGHTHQVTMGENGLWHCSDCAGWHHRKICNHVKAVWIKLKELWENNKVSVVNIDG